MELYRSQMKQEVHNSPSLTSCRAGIFCIHHQHGEVKQLMLGTCLGGQKVVLEQELGNPSRVVSYGIQ